MCPRPSQTQSEERADTLADERKSQQGPTDIYIVRVKLNRAEAVNIPDFSPTPGMEVYIKTSERTFFQYIVEPILDSMMRAFRER
jgi:HlyD family secretion protein